MTARTSGRYASEDSDGGFDVATRALLVLTTCGTPAAAERLARQLVAERLAACVNRIDRVTSCYRWKGEVEQAEESLLLIKTTEDRYAAVERTIREQSGYELPEVVAVGVERGLPDYLAWVRESVE
ncbi:MAG TPA: divalent-cation tolerance protein CutA [Gammaproteobacteria bacterium]